MVMVGYVYDFFYTFGATLGRNGGGCGEMAGGQCGAGFVSVVGFATVWHGEKIWIRMLDFGESLGGFDDATKAFVVEFVRGSTGGAAVEDSAHGDDMVFIFDILVDDVVGKSCERESSARDEDFGFVRRGEFLDALEDVGGLVLS